MSNARPSRSDRRQQAQRDRFEAALNAAASQIRSRDELSRELDAYLASLR